MKTRERRKKEKKIRFKDFYSISFCVDKRNFSAGFLIITLSWIGRSPSPNKSSRSMCDFPILLFTFKEIKHKMKMNQKWNKNENFICFGKGLSTNI